MGKRILMCSGHWSKCNLMPFASRVWCLKLQLCTLMAMLTCIVRSSCAERGAERYKHMLDGDGYVSSFAFGPGNRVHFRSRYVRTRCAPFINLICHC